MTEFIVSDLESNLSGEIGTIHLRRNILWESTPRILETLKVIQWGDNSSMGSRIDYAGKLGLVLLNPDLLGFKKDSINVVTLTSPYSFLLELVLRLRGRKLVLLVHDNVKHDGDLWPPNFVIRIRNYLADGLVVLSNTVRIQVHRRFPKKNIVVFPHPYFMYPDEKSPPEICGVKGYILFIGRIRPYKGLDALISASFVGGELDSKNIVIAGEGKLPKKLPENVVAIVRWLEESEIASLIRNAELIVFPYVEASQSGFIGTCIAFNKKILVSNLEGLVEQVDGYPNAWIAVDLSPKPLSDSILYAYSASTTKQSENQVFGKNFSDTIKILFLNKKKS